jgi:hypothetical protein
MKTIRANDRSTPAYAAATIAQPAQQRQHLADLIGHLLARHWIRSRYRQGERKAEEAGTAGSSK